MIAVYTFAHSSVCRSRSIKHGPMRTSICMTAKRAHVITRHNKVGARNAGNRTDR